MSELGGKRTNRIEIFVSDELELALRRRAEADERTLSQYCCRILVHCEEMMQQEDERAQTLPSPPTLASRQPRNPFPNGDGGEKMAR